MLISIKRKTRKDLSVTSIDDLESLLKTIFTSFKRIQESNEHLIASIRTEYNSIHEFKMHMRDLFCAKKGMSKETLYAMFGFTVEEQKDRDAHMSNRRPTFLKNAPEDWSRKQSKFCKEYWLERGFNEQEAESKIIEIQSQNSNKCSRETKKKNSPVSVDYYTARGFTQEESVYLAREEQKIRSKRCIEYWLHRGFSVEDAKKRLSKHQSSHMGNKTVEEKQKHYSTRKSPKINIKTLSKMKFDDPGMFYIVDIGDNKYKIGITINNVKARYGVHVRDLVYKEFPCSSITEAWKIECLMRKAYTKTIEKRDYGVFGWTEVVNAKSIEELENKFREFKDLYESQTN